MDRSMIAMIYLVALLALFLILIMVTIAVIASKSRRRYDDEDEESEDDEIFQDAEDMVSDDIYVDNLDLDVDAQDDGFMDSEEETEDEEDESYSEEDEFEGDYESDAWEDADDEAQMALDPCQPNAPTQELDTDAVKKEKAKTIDSAFADVLQEEEAEVSETDVEDTFEEEPAEPEASETEPEEPVEPEESAEAEALVTEEEITEDVPENTEKEIPKKSKKKQKRKKEPVVQEDSVFAQPDTYEDSAFAPEIPNIELSNEAIAASVREAEAMGAAIMGDLKAAQVSAETMFGINEQLSSYGSKKSKRAKSKVSSDEEFYWYNKEDVAERPPRRPAEIYYHYFNIANDCIEDLLVEMYDCALVRTEEIRYIAYGIEPRTLSMKEIMSGTVAVERKQKEPTTQDLVRIYEKWCGYVDHLFDKVEIHADEYTIEEIRKQLCEYGRNDVDVLLEGK